MKRLVDIKINDRVYSDIILTDEYTLEKFVEESVQENEIYHLYSDSKKFLKESVKMTIKEEDPKLKLYLLNTIQIGWDTYRSGIFTGYSPTEALENAVSFNNQFEGSSVELIGYAINDKISSVICTDFVNG